MRLICRSHLQQQKCLFVLDYCCRVIHQPFMKLCNKLSIWPSCWIEELSQAACRHPIALRLSFQLCNSVTKEELKGRLEQLEERSSRKT